MTSEQNFLVAADATLAAIGAALDVALLESDTDVDWTLRDGILTIECQDGGKIIVNRHVPNREIWVAARSGGYHFRGGGDAWMDTRSGNSLQPFLTRLLADEADLAVDLSRLPPAG
jgi:CyaY protein